jgi:hypothetical protein
LCNCWRIFFIVLITPFYARLLCDDSVLQVMRLKDKLGDRANASSEVEYRGAWGQLIGESAV